KFASELANTNFTVTQGYYIDDTSKEIKEIGRPFLKLATLKSDDTASTENKNFNTQYTFNYNSGEEQFELYSKYNAKDKVYTYKDSMTEEEKSTVPIEVGTACVVNTNASTVGMIIGAGSLSYITSSSVNLSINVTYTNKMTNLSNGVKYVGAVIGRNIGEMRYVASTSNITVSVPTGVDAGTGDIENMFVGGIVGNVQGIIRYAYVKNNTITVGKANRHILARNGADGIFVGGVVGEIDRYTTVNEAIVGGANYLYINDCQIDAYVKGPSNIAGAIGKNSFTVGDIYLKQSKNASGGTDKSINVYVNDSNSSLIVGGIISTNKSTYINNIYSNSSIYAHVQEFANIIMGGIIAQIETDCEMTNIVNDAQELKVQKTGNALAQASIGGIIAAADSSSSKITLIDVFSSVNIVAEQEKKLNIGGAIGGCSNLIVCNVIVLGNITIHRGSGDGTVVKKNSTTVSSDNYFYSQPHNIGGLIGDCSNYTESVDNEGVIVLSTIRDYAIAQKLQLNIGPVIGKGNQSGEKKIANTQSKTYFCEPISLVSDNGYNQYFVNVDQSIITSEKAEDISLPGYGIYKKVYAHILGRVFKLDESTKVYSNYFTNYYVLGSTPNYKEGSKLLPYVYAGGTLQKDTYYILNKNISTTLVSGGTGWVLNGQGNRIVDAATPKVDYWSGASIINTIPEDSALVGVMVVANKVAVSPIALTNQGFIFGCGTAGTIGKNSNSLGGLVETNTGVINSCFSIANITTEGAAGGLVNSNGEGSYIGNIYSSYYTGTIYPTNDTCILAGIAVTSFVGVISNSYTMGDIDITTYKNATTYPVANTIKDGKNKYNLYNTYYDYVAYTGSNEGITKDEALDYEVKNLERVNQQGKYVYGLISNKGVYVWSSTLAGDEKGLNYVNMEDLLKGSWLKPGNEEQIINMFKKTYTGNEEVKINTSWFNYGYTTNNMTNIVVNIDGNIVDYLQMLYTGNGLAAIENVTAQNPVISYNTFIDRPYQIKHAGMLDILVRANNSGAIQFKYYIFERNLDFVKYSKQTYWSESWDNNFTVFVGDLDGNDKIVYNMYSSFGLLRALPEISSITKKTVVKDFTFENCYSKTGLVAGYQSTGSIQNVKFNNSMVLNGDWTGKIKSYFNDNYYEFEATFPGAGTGSFAGISLKTISIKTAESGTVPTMGLLYNSTYVKFAGGVVGIMEGGTIAQSNTFTKLNVVLADSSVNDKAGFVGGLVGIMSGDVKQSTIAGTSSKNFVVGGINVYSIFTDTGNASTPYVGGIAGIVLEGAKISYVKLNTNATTVSGFYTVGGIAGQVFGGLIENCNNANSLRVGNAKITVSDNKPTVTLVITKVKTFEVSVGGIAGELISGDIQNSSLGYNLSFTTDYVSFVAATDSPDEAKETFSLGGIVGKISNKDGVESPSVIGATVEKEVVISKSIVKAYVGGLVGSMYHGNVGGSESSSSVQATSTVQGIAGGVVGYLENGSIGTETKGTASIQATHIAGGIVGQAKIANVNYKIEVKNTQTNGGSIQTTTLNSTATGGVVGLIVSELNNDDSQNYILVQECTTKNSVLVGTTNATYSGGIIGAIFNMKETNERIKVQNCTNEAKVDAGSGNPSVQRIEGKDVISGVSFTGGIVGYMTFSYLYDNDNKGTIGSESAAYYAGGIIGHMQNGEVKDSLNEGDVTATQIAGGIVGISLNTTYFTGGFENKGTIKTSNGIAGGLFGIMSDTTTLKTATTSYAELTNSGIVQDNTISGGVIGLFNGNSTQAITNATNSGNIKVNSSATNIKDIKKIAVDYTDKNGFFLKLNNYVIPNDTVVSDSAGGIIGYSQQKLTIYDLATDTASYVDGKTTAGGIVGNADALLLITDVTNNGSVKAAEKAGGIIGTSNSSLEIITNKDDAHELEIYKAVTNKGSVEATNNAAGGIIGYVASIKQIGAEGISGTIINEGTITSSKYAGGVIGYLQESGSYGINSTTNKGSVTSSLYAGGLVGYMGGGTLTSTNKIDLASGKEIKSRTGGSATDIYAAGGVVGYLTGSSSEVYVNVDKVKFGASKYVGGVVGYLNGGSVGSTVKCDIETTGTTYAGGIAGYMDGSSSLKEAKVDEGKKVEADNYAGGLVGHQKGGTISGGQGGNPEAGTAAGGIVGRMSGGTINGGNGGSVTVNGTSRGGIAGEMDDSSATITNESDDNKPQGGAAKDGSNNGGMVGLMSAGTISGGRGGTAKGGDAGGIVGEMTGGSITKGRGGTVESGSNCGGIVGYLNSGKISGTATGGTVENGGNSGGIAGYMSGGSIEGGLGGYVQWGTDAGGLVGEIGGGSISSGGGAGAKGSNAGGVVGRASAGITINGGGASSVEGTNYAGGVVGYNAVGTSFVINVNFAGSVEGSGTTGGLIGYGGGSVCSTTITVSSEVDGGIVGTLDGKTLFFGRDITIKAAKAKYLITETNDGSIGSTSEVSIKGNDYEGTLVKTNSGKITNLNVSGVKVPAETTIDSYGVIAEINDANGQIGYCTNSSSLDGGDSIKYLGGIVGKNNGGKIIDCINKAAISSKKATYIGGIAGYVDGGTIHCKNEGNISFDSTTATDKTAAAGRDQLFGKFNTTPTANVGGIAGYVSSGTVEGHNTDSAKIKNDVSYTTNGHNQSIVTDYRGKVAGFASSSATITHLKVSCDAVEHTVYEETTKEESTGVVITKRHLAITITYNDHSTQLSGFLQNVSESDYNVIYKDNGDIDNYIVDNFRSWSVWNPPSTLKTWNGWKDEYLLPGDGDWSTNALSKEGLKWLAKIYLKDEFDSYTQTPVVDTNIAADIFTGIGYFSILAFERIYNEMETVYDFEAGGLQDCGGKVTGAETSGGSGDNKINAVSKSQVDVLKELYDKCGPCKDHSSTSISVEKASGTKANGGPGASGGAYYESELDVVLSGTYAQRMAGIQAAYPDITSTELALVTTALQIKQQGTGFIYTLDYGANYYTNSKGTEMDNNVSYTGSSPVYWCVGDVVTAIMTGGVWKTDCCGFIRLVTHLVFGSQKGAYPEGVQIAGKTVNGVFMATDMRPGDVIYITGP
ncbi:MAG: hypothetical protein IKA31_05185, partial [Clostridia bacterium]|nr:hypothetical protein [Clostridia bacterium]